MATTNPFDVSTGANTGLGLIASQAPQVAGTAVQASQVGAPQAVNTQQATAAGADTTSATALGAPAAAQMTAAQAEAQRAAIDPATQTVQGQLASILSSGNPLLVQAQTRAKQEANRRGLINSSMAVGAGETALQGAALPIATSDANAYNQAALSNAERAQQTALANQSATNRAGEVNVGETNTTSRFNTGEANVIARQNASEANTTARQNAGEANTTARQNASEGNVNTRFSAEQLQASRVQNAQLGQQASMQTAQNAQQANLANQDAQTKLMLQQMDATTRTDLTNIEANYKTLMQASASASDLYQQTLRTITDITANKDMDAAAKNAAIAQQKELLANGMNLIGAMNNIGVSDLLNFGGSGAGGVTANPVPEPLRTTQPVPTRGSELDYIGDQGGGG